MGAIALAGASGLVLLLAVGAEAGVDAGGNDRTAPPVAAPNPRAPATYQLRCWQYGRLLFDEGPVTLGAEARQAAKVVAFDRHGAALIVTDSGGTTCLARPYGPPRNLALPN
jgi:hypothetical protein